MFDEVVELLDPDMKPTGSEIEVGDSNLDTLPYICVLQMTTPPDSPSVMQEKPSTRVDSSKVRLRSFYTLLPAWNLSLRNLLPMKKHSNKPHNRQYIAGQ